MDIILEDIGRRFNQDWVFRHIHYRFVMGQRYAVLGPNGSGKSTLLRLVAANLSPSAGLLQYNHGTGAVDPDRVFRYMSLAAPYMELIEEFSLKEQIRFHFSHKSYLDEFNEQRLLEWLELGPVQDKQLRYFSSGMKQRVKLVLACCADTPLLLLDEPTTNLDEEGVAWYLELLERTTRGRLLLIGSNQEREYSFCDHAINITDYKTF